MQLEFPEDATKIEDLSLQSFTRDIKLVLGRIIERIAELEATQSHQDQGTYPLHIRFDGYFLQVQNARVALHSRPLSRKLIQAYFDTNCNQLSREQITEYVYEMNGVLTARRQKCVEVNLNKLISRTRRSIEEGLSGTCWDKQLEWLVSDAETKTWSLYVVRGVPSMLRDTRSANEK